MADESTPVDNPLPNIADPAVEIPDGPDKKGGPSLTEVANAIVEGDTKDAAQDATQKGLADKIAEQGEVLDNLEKGDAKLAAEDRNHSQNIETQGKTQNKIVKALKELRKLNLLKGISSKEKLRGNIKMIYIIGSIITTLLLSSPLLSKLIVGGGLKRRTKRR